MLELQMHELGGSPPNPIGHYDFRLGDDIHVFQGCGLGGTYHVNANVSLPPDPRVFEDPRWPQPIHDDRITTLRDAPWAVRSGDG